MLLSSYLEKERGKNCKTPPNFEMNKPPFGDDLYEWRGLVNLMIGI